MAIPEGGFSSTPVGSVLLAPDEYERLDLLMDLERGGVGIADPSQGLDVRDWVVRTDGSEIWVAPYPEELPRTVVYTGAGITEVSLAFVGNMEPVVAFVEAGACKLRWFDTLINGWTVSTFAGAVSPMVTLDDKRPFALPTCDVIFAYIREGQVRYRTQRDRFTIEETLGAIPAPSSRIVGLGMGTNLRVQVKLSVPPSARFRDLASDALYLVSGDDLVQVGAGDVSGGLWRSRMFEAHEVPSMGWARVEGDYPATLRVIGDGQLVFSSPPILDGEPFRIEAGQWRTWEIEIESAERVVLVALAQTLEELS